MIQIAARKRCALYNELSHMTPYYLYDDNSWKFNLEREVKFHLNVLTLLSLYFDYIFIPIENLCSFANRRNKLVVENVVLSTKFTEMHKLGIIKICGWGVNNNQNMYDNAMRYSMKFYSELKSKDYVTKFENITKSSQIYIRDSTGFDIGHDMKLLRALSLMDNAVHEKVLQSIKIFVREFYFERSFIGSLEYYRQIEDVCIDQSLLKNLYYSYYVAWNEYCLEYYQPVVTVSTNRIPYSTSYINVGTEVEPCMIPAFLYSPKVFHSFLMWQIGPERIAKIFNLKVGKLDRLRNGDWSIFVEKYHTCINAVTNIDLILGNANIFENNNDTMMIEQLLEPIFGNSNAGVDMSSIIDGIKFLLPFSILITSLFDPTESTIALISWIRKKIKASPFSNEVKPFYKKIETMLREPSSMQKAPLNVHFQ